MNAKALKVLEYDKITELLAGEATSDASRRMAAELEPMDDAHLIREELGSTTEAVDLIQRKGPLPVSGLYDISGPLLLARKGGTLTMKELLQVHYDLSAAQAAVSFMKGEDLPALPRLRAMTDILETFPELEGEIDRCILTEDEMADSASPKLRQIRRDIGVKNDSIRNRLNKLISSQTGRTYLQDQVVTIRDGRYVIPVKQEHRARFPGIVHDQSRGGQTLFIEPQAVVDLNNELRELEVAEQAEIQRILFELSSRVAEHFSGIRNNLKLMTRLDFIMAKGKLSRRMDGEEPSVNESGEFSLVAARHPLIDKKQVVPIDISIGRDYRTLIITGPNTGGKTVSLKTAGLLAMMAMSGLHIPASGRSNIAVFREIFADIGDEQSIEQSLSTFSSHMKNLVEIIDKAGADSLVLLDELGAGTDPTEGAALGVAILERLYAGGACTMATTHYNELKKYALSTAGVENACMEFDVETLSPTYRLMIGAPGKSNAFEISRKLGLLPEVIGRASELIERGDLEFEDVIGSIEEDRKKAEAARREAEDLRTEMDARRRALEAKESELREKRDRIVEEARDRARGIIREARETSREVEREMQALAKEGRGRSPDVNRLERSRRRLREAEEKYAGRPVRQVNSEPVAAGDLRIGDRVRVLSLGQNGEVTGLPDSRGGLTVAIGQLRLTVGLNDLMLINEGAERRKPAPRRTSYGGIYSSKSRNVSASLNVQGLGLEEAVAEVEKYLDDVYIAGLDKVTIIHGRGEGILKSGIRRMLKANKCVRSFAPGNYNEGGEGVTIVTMKKD